jgi:DNA repair exonuclease SbcCD ATPase subunit
MPLWDDAKKLIAEKKRLESLLKETFQLSSSVEPQIDRLEQASDFLTQLTSKLQKELKEVIEEVTNDCLLSVYGNKYKFKIELGTLRGLPSARVKLMKGKKELSLSDEDVGGGVVNVVAFAVRLSMWLITANEDEVMLLDEPFKDLHTSTENNRRLVVFISRFCRRFKKQIILVSAENVFGEEADRHFVITQQGGISKVEIIK